MFKKMWFVGILVAVSMSMVGCGNSNQAALDGMKGIEDACAAGKKDEAKKIGDDLLTKDDVFKKAVTSAAPDVKDTSKLNWCGALFKTELKMRLKNM